MQRLCIMLNTEKRVCINVTWSPGLMYGAKTVFHVEYRKEGMYIEDIQMFLLNMSFIS